MAACSDHTLPRSSARASCASAAASAATVSNSTTNSATTSATKASATSSAAGLCVPARPSKCSRTSGSRSPSGYR